MTERHFDEPFDASGIPRANSWRLYFCGRCPNAHLVFYDCLDNPIAHATLTAAQARSVAQRIEAIDPNFREIEP
jgi:hypothetical protein